MPTDASAIAIHRHLVMFQSSGIGLVCTCRCKWNHAFHCIFLLLHTNCWDEAKVRSLMQGLKLQQRRHDMPVRRGR